MPDSEYKTLLSTYINNLLDLGQSIDYRIDSRNAAQLTSQSTSSSSSGITQPPIDLQSTTAPPGTPTSACNINSNNGTCTTNGGVCNVSTNNATCTTYGGDCNVSGNNSTCITYGGNCNVNGNNATCITYGGNCQNVNNGSCTTYGGNCGAVNNGTCLTTSSQSSSSILMRPNPGSMSQISVLEYLENELTQIDSSTSISTDEKAQVAKVIEIYRNGDYNQIMPDSYNSTVLCNSLGAEIVNNICNVNI